MTLNAKTVLKNKFWIIEDNGRRVGTLSKGEDLRFMYSCATGTEFFENTQDINHKLGNINWSTTLTDKDTIKEVHGYPTASTPHNTMYDVKRRLPLFTKSAKSKSLYCAGYYIIHFDKGWVRSFCPKLLTCEKYEYKGPFKTEFEMRQELSNANRAD